MTLEPPEVCGECRCMMHRPSPSCPTPYPLPDPPLPERRRRIPKL